MRITGNTMLVTGGSTGIGFAIAESFAKLGNTVIICGRRQEKLEEAKKKIPGIHIIRCDISREPDRKALFKTVSSEFKKLNILVNNAGIQRPISLKEGNEELVKADDEIETNLKSQIHMSAMFIPLLSKQKESAIVNVSSGLGFVPLSRFPVYCATKAALHSFTMSLRHQLNGTGISVFELIPPIVYDTELKGKPIKKEDWTVSSSEVAEALMKGIEAGEAEIAVGPSKRWLSATKAELDEAFRNINR